MLSPSGVKDKLFYGWVVVAVFFVIGIALYGIHFSFGVFFKSIEAEFGLSRAATSAIMSANLLLAGFYSFLAGRALDKYGPKKVILSMGIFAGLSLLLTSQTNAVWQLFLTYSLLLAMGTGPLYVVPMSIVSRWFDKKRGLAMGVSSTGVGLGTLVMAPFATYLITSFSWRTAYLVMGLIAWVMVVPLSRLLKRDPSEVGALPDGIKSREAVVKSEKSGPQPVKPSLWLVFRNRNFWFMIGIHFFFASCVFLVFTHLVPHITDIGFSAGEAATVLSLIGLASILGRMGMGIVSDRLGRRLAVVICIVFQAVAILWLVWGQNMWSLYLFALVYGVFYSGFGTCFAALISDTFGLGQLGAIFGLLEAGFGIGAATGPFIGGFVFDVTHSYDVAFLYGAGAMLAATLLTTLVGWGTTRNLARGENR